MFIPLCIKVWRGSLSTRLPMNVKWQSARSAGRTGPPSCRRVLTHTFLRLCGLFDWPQGTYLHEVYPVIITGLRRQTATVHDPLICSLTLSSITGIVTITPGAVNHSLLTHGDQRTSLRGIKKMHIYVRTINSKVSFPTHYIDGPTNCTYLRKWVLQASAHLVHAYTCQHSLAHTTHHK